MKYENEVPNFTFRDKITPLQLNFSVIFYVTKMHSSRMHTAHFNGHLYVGVCVQGMYTPLPNCMMGYTPTLLWTE